MKILKSKIKYSCQRIYSLKKLLHILEGKFVKWRKEKEKTKLRISGTPISLLDPRRGGDRNATTILRALFDGLTRFDINGNLSLSLAKSFSLSKNQKEYVFTLRKSYWSNGDPVTAYDFEYAWKTSLHPSFPIDFPEFFYCIKNAEPAKKDKASLDEIGIKAKSRYTLLIDLEHPTPDFLELLAHTLFFPIPSRIAKKDPNWARKKGIEFVSNGPFCLEKPKPGILFQLKKNPYSFREKEVRIDQISVIRALPTAAVRLFKEGKLDFLEIPNRSEGEFAVEENDMASVSFPAPTILWFAINTSSFPLTNIHFRKALSASINREELKKLFPCLKESALTLLPKHLTQHKEADFLIRYNPDRARTYFESALLELGLTREKFPPTSLMIPDNRFRKSIAGNLKTEWEKLFGIHFEIESYPWQTFYERRIAKKFKLAMVEWGAPTNDPISILSAFRRKEDKLNLSTFENSHYKELLETAQRETDLKKRKMYAAQLEEILIRQACVLPIFYGRFWFFKRPNLKISPITSSFNGMPDFSYFSFK